jgi:hypothetical protein
MKNMIATGQVQGNHHPAIHHEPQFNDVCKKHGMTEDQKFEFSDYVHHLKDSGHGGSGKDRDFTFGELDELAAEFLGRENE